jgi:hypothetical protein
MLNNQIPKCYKGLQAWLKGKSARLDIYNKINPVVFDVTLRDGLQGIKPELIEKYTTKYKADIFYENLFNHSPTKVEVGSFVNPRVLRIMADSTTLFKDLNTAPNLNDVSLFMLVPSFKYLGLATMAGVKNFSFITSVSQDFQLKNINKTMEETKKDLNKIFQVVNKNKATYKTKLYISCINECPIKGKIDKDLVVNEVLKYYTSLYPDELCLSDTCGTLSFADYKYIIDNCLKFGLPKSILSLHLHINEKNPNDVNNFKNIFFYSLDNSINKFDVSSLENGGCSVTMDENNMRPNLSYNLYYSFLTEYIEYKINDLR